MQLPLLELPLNFKPGFSRSGNGSLLLPFVACVPCTEPDQKQALTKCLLSANGWLHNSDMQPCGLGQGLAEWQTPGRTSSDIGWLSLEQVCETWPSLPSGWVHFPGGCSDPHALEPWLTHPRGPPDLPRSSLDPGVKMAWAQARSQLHKQQQLECQMQELWEGRMVTSDWEVTEGVGQVIRVRDQLHLGTQCSGAVVRSPLWKIILGDGEIKVVCGQL